MRKNKASILVIMLVSTLSVGAISTSMQPLSPKMTLVQKIACGTMGLIIGKLSYDFYYGYVWPASSMIRFYRRSFETIYTALQRYQAIYASDLQKDYYALTATINTQRTSYPFIHYRSELINALYELRLHQAKIQSAISHMQHRKDRISPLKPCSAHTLSQLCIQGNNLHKLLDQAIQCLTLLNNRIDAMPEYQREHDLWKHNQKETAIDMRCDSSEPSCLNQPSSNSCGSASSTLSENFDRVQEEIMQFNLDYY